MQARTPEAEELARCIVDFHGDPGMEESGIQGRITELYEQAKKPEQTKEELASLMLDIAIQQMPTNYKVDTIDKFDLSKAKKGCRKCYGTGKLGYERVRKRVLVCRCVPYLGNEETKDLDDTDRL